ncbi:hypothetical protein G7Z17_g4928 [Cylindrodendrum hubeiense]|uniref:Uncharacterized protein n=1 Tax=Cylindrodendrum hubeiense TaxID=595255 RepID=A0A9P5LID3_9HYPO|nr:hypothetical protein G7Z17_g4928 [Cylindrodendrum hubeiense]
MNGIKRVCTPSFRQTTEPSGSSAAPTDRSLACSSSTSPPTSPCTSITNGRRGTWPMLNYTPELDPAKPSPSPSPLDAWLATADRLERIRTGGARKGGAIHGRIAWDGIGPYETVETRMRGNGDDDGADSHALPPFLCMRIEGTRYTNGFRELTWAVDLGEGQLDAMRRAGKVETRLPAQQERSREGREGGESTERYGAHAGWLAGVAAGVSIAAENYTAALASPGPGLCPSHPHTPSSLPPSADPSSSLCPGGGASRRGHRGGRRGLWSVVCGFWVVALLGCSSHSHTPSGAKLHSTPSSPLSAPSPGLRRRWDETTRHGSNGVAKGDEGTG